MLSQQQRRSHLETVMKPDEAFINKHGTEIQGIMDDRVPLEYAIEIAKSRHGMKTEGAANARTADVAKLAGGKGRARASVPVAQKEEVDVNDPASIMRAEMAKGVVDPDPMALD